MRRHDTVLSNAPGQSVMRGASWQQIERVTSGEPWGSETLPMDVAEELDLTRPLPEDVETARSEADADSVRLYFQQVGRVPLLKLELRYGRTNAREHRLHEIARRLGASRERVRQIEAQALDRLRRRRHHLHRSEAA